MKDLLAVKGGKPTITSPFTSYNPIGIEEAEAVKKVIDGGNLSQYIAAWTPDFYGGNKVQEFERACEKYFKVKHAITVNSWTSGLIAAVGAIGIEPGDEVIVSPWTMCASATAILHWNAIPVFADIDPDSFCLSPESVENNITPYTKAIMSVDIFGHSADMDSLRDIAKRYNLKIISDTAQAPAALYKGKYAGTLADVGGYSLNYHKHIHTGEGGILVTDDDEIAERLRLIRNHAEAVVEEKGEDNLNNMLGYNFRLGEIECAIGIEQLKKLKGLVEKKQKAAEQLTEGLEGLTGLKTPKVMPECTHAYYGYPLVLELEKLPVNRDSIFEALKAEGVPISKGYQNIHLLPMYQQKIAYGSKGFPWSSDICKRDVSYTKGICPVAEDLHFNRQLGVGLCGKELSTADVELIISAFWKVWNNMESLV